MTMSNNLFAGNDEKASGIGGPSSMTVPDESNDSLSFACEPPSGPPVFRSSFALLSLHMTDRIRLLDFPPAAIGVVRQTIRTAWPLGVQDERNYYGSHEFKLRGNPWLGQSEEAMHARRLTRGILEALFNHGWLLSLSTDVSKKKSDKDTLIFRQQTPTPPPCDWTCIGFSRSDRLRVMDAPQELLDAIREEIRSVIQETLQHKLPGVWEVKLHGYPWLAEGGESMSTRRLLLQLLTVLERHGFTVYASIDQKANQDKERSETDTWHCCRPKSWALGAPVYHA